MFCLRVAGVYRYQHGLNGGFFKPRFHHALVTSGPWSHVPAVEESCRDQELPPLFPWGYRTSPGLYPGSRCSTYLKYKTGGGDTHLYTWQRQMDLSSSPA